MAGMALYSYWNIYSLWIKTSFLHAMLMQKLIQKPSVDWQKSLSTFMVFYIAFPLIKEFLSEQNCGNRPMLMEFAGIITDLSATIAWWKGLLNTQLQCCLVPIPCRAGARFSRRPYMLWISIQYSTAVFVFFFSKARIQESRNQRLEMEVVPLTIINNNPLAKFCLLFQWLYSLLA